MKLKTIITIAAFGLCLFAGPAVRADPMKCSGEEKSCIASCQKNPNGSTVSACVTACGARQSYCMKTGCWNNGASRYCGLTRQ